MYFRKLPDYHQQEKPRVSHGCFYNEFCGLIYIEKKVVPTTQTNSFYKKAFWPLETNRYL